MDEREIIELFLKRDEAAVLHVKQQFGARLKRIAFGIVHDERTAEECEQDALFDAWNSIPPNEPHGYLFAYLARLARCRAIDRLAAEKTSKRSTVLVELTSELASVLPSGDDVEKTAEADELMRLINAFLDDLPKHKRDIFVRRYWFMDSVSDIARMTGSGESRVKMILYRLREKLKAYLDKHGYGV